MPFVVRFVPKNMSSQKYDEVIKRLDAAGAGSPQGRIFHVAFGDAGALRISDIGAPDFIETHNVIAGK